MYECMKKWLFLFVVLFASCNNYLDKSVFEPLSLNELNKEIKKDSMFSFIYQAIQKVYENVLKSDVDKAKYADLTYARMLDTYNYRLDSNELKKVKKEWFSNYGSIRENFNIDSISNYWLEYQRSNPLDKYVKIEFIGFDKNESSHTSRKLYLYSKFKITPLKGNIDKINCVLDFSNKKSNKKNVFFFWLKRDLLYKRLMPTTISVLSEALIINGSDDKIDIDYDDFNIDNIRIKSICQNGESIEFKDTPFDIERYWEYKEIDKIDLMNHAIDEIIFKTNSSYIREYSYIQNRVKDMRMKNDPLACEYLSLIDKLEKGR